MEISKLINIYKMWSINWLYHKVTTVNNLCNFWIFSQQASRRGFLDALFGHSGHRTCLQIRRPWVRNPARSFFVGLPLEISLAPFLPKQTQSVRNVHRWFRALQSSTMSFLVRVTRLGEFSPIGGQLTLGHFLKITKSSPPFWATFFIG
jgi:hypothetical protein